MTQGSPTTSGRRETVIAKGYGVDPNDPARLVPLERGSRADGAPVATISPPAVCVILPVYNESKLIHHTFDAVLDFARRFPGYAFLFVDDGSSDGTPGILRERIQRCGLSTIRLHAYPQNQGKGYAIHAGIGAPEAGEGGVVCFTDGDLAYPLDHLPQLVEALQDADVVIGSRSLVHKDEKNTSVPRRILGWGFNRLARLILHLPYRDTQAGLKGFRLEAARRIFARQRLRGFAFDVEMVFLAKRLGFRISEIPARVSEEHSYKISKVRLVRDPISMFWALLAIRLNALRGLYE